MFELVMEGMGHDLIQRKDRQVRGPVCGYPARRGNPNRVERCYGPQIACKPGRWERRRSLIGLKDWPFQGLLRSWTPSGLAAKTRLGPSFMEPSGRYNRCKGEAIMRMVMVLGLLLMAARALAKDAPLYKTEDCNKYTAQMDLNMCAGNNYQSADDALNAMYKKLLAANPDPRSAQGLRQSERDWIRARDRKCNDEVGPQSDGGSIWPMEMSNCLEKQTAGRIRMLQAMLACSAPGGDCRTQPVTHMSH
jgi:uncharacterized protein YecT (DUF1311 family)